MNPRLLRFLIRLYPRGWRRRYGDELQDLVGELAERREQTQARLAHELIAHAATERLRRLSRPSLEATTALIAIAAVVGVATHALGNQSTDGKTVLALNPAHAAGTATRQARRTGTLRTPQQSGQSCFVASGSICSGQAHSCPVSQGSDCAATACSTFVSAGAPVAITGKTTRTLGLEQRTLATHAQGSACATGHTEPVAAR